MKTYRLTRRAFGFYVEEDAAPPRGAASILCRPDGKGWWFRPWHDWNQPPLAQSKTWRSPEAALVGFGLMTRAQARYAVTAALNRSPR